jgi:hypothetical protein
VSAFTNDVGYVSDVSDKVDKTTDLNRVYGTDAQGDQTTYDFASLGGGNVDDVKVNNVSVVSNKIANIDLTTKLDKSASIQDIVYVTSLPSSPVATTLYLIS